MNDSDRLKDLISIIEEAIRLLPDTSRNRLLHELRTIQDLIMNARPPKILILGRRGAGKSSLVNAIFGEKVAEVGAVVSETSVGQWYRYQSSRGSLEMLDTRGLGDRTRPEAAHFENTLEEIKAGLRSEYPDAILFLCKAKEVDARISEDIQQLKQIQEYIQQQHSYKAPVLASLTQVDELDPVDISTPPYEDEEKQAHIQEAVGALSSAFEQEKIPLIKVIPTSAYARFKEGRQVSQRYWNIDLLVNFLIDVLPKTAQLELARISQVAQVQKKIARLIITSSATICAGIAAVPLPVADLIPITSAQVAMVTAIGYVAGRELNQQSATEFMTALGINVGAGFALREAARAIAKFIIPGGGALVSSGIAFAATWGIGEAAIAYFIDETSIEIAKQRYETERTKS